ncbi:interleukin-17 receptor A [Ranitomeya imitator]|uniref:interleukin-17 receptor A n=1 Tax=Ranitomeya imitator TaxID=111125 RepID=UPI0037E8454D
MAPAVRLLVLAGLLGVARGLRVIHSPAFNCSQPGIECTVRDSDCLDLSWLRPEDWTPTAPSSMAATAGIGLNETGHRVPVLMVNWTLGIDFSIRILQGAEISVLDFLSGRSRCVQFQFNNRFDSQRDRQQQAWKFFYDKFEVFPGNEYLVSVQHLPKERHGSLNRREQRFRAPGCSEDGMMETWTCCKEGYCWSPKISLEFSGDQLIVTFTPRSDALRYGVQVDIRDMEIMRSAEVVLQQGATSERVQVIITNPVPYEPCWYNVSVWPQMDNCRSDCVRQWYAPTCPPSETPAPLTPVPPIPVHVWLIVAAVMVMAFVGTIIFFWRFRDCIYGSGKTSAPPPSVPPPPPPLLEKQKVWLVYSADHELYVNVVVRLADFLRLAWGLDVILDRYQSQMIGIKGAMAWLGYQKAEIEKSNGTILILCSRGVQAKWRAMQTGQEERVSLPEDAAYMFGDLFTPALANILPDFQMANPYDRYLVAYFSDLSDFGDIPSPLEICPRYALIENLEHLLFRIQRIESHQPNVQYNVDVAGHPSYRYLVKAVEQCRTWQETHVDWLGREYISAQADEQPVVDEEAEHELTRRVCPRILQPETSVSLVSPHLTMPEPLRSVNPSLVDGYSAGYVVPQINEEPSPVTFVKPSLNMEALEASYRQQPFLVDADESVPLHERRLDQMVLSIPTDQDGVMEDLGEAQRRFLCQTFFDQCADPEEVFHAEDPRLSPAVDLERSLLDSLRQVDLPMLSDQGGQSEDFGEAQKRFLLQSDFVDQAGAMFNPLVDDTYSDMCESVQGDLLKAQHKFLLQTILGDQHIASDLVPGTEWPATVNERQPLLPGTERPVTVHERQPLLPGTERPVTVYERQPLLPGTERPVTVYERPPLLPSTERPVTVHERQPLLRDTNKPLPTGSENFPLTYPSSPTDFGEMCVLGGQRMSPQMDYVYEQCGGHDLNAGQTDNKHRHFEDLGYGTMNPNNGQTL